MGLWRKAAHARLLGVAALVLLASTTTGCHHTDTRAVACGTIPTGTVQLYGPLASVVTGGGEISDVKSSRPIRMPELAVPLKVSGSQPVILDGVALQPFKGVAVPKVVVSQVVGDSTHALRCFQLMPAKSYGHGGAPQLVLTVVTTHPVAFNKTTQVFYHTPDGRHYAAIFAVQFVLCVKGEVTHAKCLAEFSSHMGAS